MAGMKRLAERIADDNLSLFYVHISTDQGEGFIKVYAENAGDAGHQADNLVPYCDIELIETSDEFEARTGHIHPHPKAHNCHCRVCRPLERPCDCKGCNAI